MMPERRWLADRGVRDALSGLGSNPVLRAVTVQAQVGGEEFALTFRKLLGTRSSGERHWTLSVTVARVGVNGGGRPEQQAYPAEVERRYDVSIDDPADAAVEACLDLYQAARAAIAATQAGA
jgi:hypothetical protein